MATLSAAEEAKLSSDLLNAIQGEAGARVDVLVQLASPSQALEDSCDRSGSADLDRSLRVACVAGSLQRFAEAAQQPVKDLLGQHEEQFGSSTFLWISNSVAVKEACVDLVVALAQLDGVEKIELEQMFAVQAGGGEEILFTTG
ncbi:hypothetical protein P3T76_004348 [Phytophthora citrophthora]|uniref:Uncharacterized protein n=1 Tax=Phytophthora citrophthora TaxID=4793 RepID=A0AAD9LQ88_9STRA|nr:hypothetical protein P3T76_004348 [Phytophthora citrophthora]